MQRKKDDLDRFIIDSFEDIDLSIDYNEKLLRRIKTSKQKNQINVEGICFVTSGILLITLNLTNYLAKFFELQYLLRVELNILFQNINKIIGV